LFAKNKTSILEIDFIEIGNNLIVSPNQVSQSLEFASRLFDGCCVQNLLGATYVSLYPAKGQHYQLHLKELDGYKIINAKHEKRILMVIAYKNGKYYKYIYKIDNTYTTYQSPRIINDISLSGLNFTVLDNGICVHLNDEEKLELFNGPNIKEIEDPTVLSGDMKLISYGVQVMFVRDDKVYSLKMIK
jgi:hypothetical protein